MVDHVSVEDKILCYEHTALSFSYDCPTKIVPSLEYECSR